MLSRNSETQKTILCFSGWGQKHDSLSSIFDNEVTSTFDIQHYNYTKHLNLTNFLQYFQNHLENYNEVECLVGWSLGGQLATFLAAKQIIKVKKLILIAPPFQFVKDQRINAAMPQKSYLDFYNNFTNSPTKTLKKFIALTAMNDMNSKEIINNLEINNDNHKALGSWLEELGKISCFDLEFNTIPPTLYIHGQGDLIVHIRQKDYYEQRIKDFKEVILKKAGHAPHLSSKDIIQQTVHRFLLRHPISR